LLQRLEQRLPLLSGGPRDLPLRQQTMRDTIGWSYDLLSADEQIMFRRMAVFVGGFTISSAESVRSLAGEFNPGSVAIPSIDVIEGVIALVEHSLLRQSDGGAGEPRFLMLETVREFGCERLEELGETEYVRNSHAAWCLELARQASPNPLAVPDAIWLARLDS